MSANYHELTPMPFGKYAGTPLKDALKEEHPDGIWS